MICGVAINKGNRILSNTEVLAERKHAEILPNLTEECFKKINHTINDIDAIAISIGPGSFTGLRGGLGFAKGLAYAKNLPIIPIPTLLSLAYSLRKYEPKQGIVYSHSKKVFYQKFKWSDNIPKTMEEPTVGEIDDYIFKLNNSFHYNCETIINSNNLPLMKATPSANNIGLLGSIYFDDWLLKEPYDLTPSYIAPFNIGKNI